MAISSAILGRRKRAKANRFTRSRLLPTAGCWPSPTAAVKCSSTRSKFAISYLPLNFSATCREDFGFTRRRVRARFDPVSYTHLRAHETPEHLVCRLLLEKKKKKKKNSGIS